MHVAIIMDGNGRWAGARNLARQAGHRAGARSVDAIVRAAARHGSIRTLTLYAFSADNWQRPAGEVQALFAVSDGNLSAHARKLEEAGYLSCTKSFEGRRPKTVYRLTASGRAALNRYLDHVEAVIKATRRG